MHAPGAETTLATWEAGAGQSPAEQALMLLAAAAPDRTPDELAQLPLGERDRLLLDLRAAMLGQHLEACADCPDCATRLEFAVAVDDLVAADHRAIGEPAGQLEHGGWLIRYRVPNSTDLLAVADSQSVNEARTRLLRRCVLHVARDGKREDSVDLPPALTDRLAALISECDPQAETVLALSCPDCGADWRAELDVAAFVWLELDSLARTLMGEVDTLARAYGWSETEVLALGAARRRWYLERVMA